MLFTFPSRYLFAIGRQGVLRLGGWSPHVQTGLHVSRLTRIRKCFLPVRGYHPLLPGFPSCSSSYTCDIGLIRFRSPLLAESLLMSFPPDTKMFQFSGFAPTHYVFMCRSGLSQGLPHSEIAGSKPIRGSPTLIAAYHVLHRLSVPRHPPNALKSLDRSHYQCSSGLLDLGKEIQLMNIDAEKHLHSYHCFKFRLFCTGTTKS